jgi:hypothetical protein
MTGFQVGILVVGVTPGSSPILAAPAATEPSPVSRSNQCLESRIDQGCSELTHWRWMMQYCYRDEQ